MTSIKEYIADLIFVIRAPEDGTDLAVSEASRLSRSWFKISMFLNVVASPWLLRRGGYRRELLAYAHSFVTSGTDPDVAFMAILNKLNNVLNSKLQWINASLTAVIVLSIMTSVLAFLTILGAPPIVGLINLLYIPLIHYYQIELAKYDYVKPMISGLAGLGIGLTVSLLLLRLPGLMAATVSIMTFGIGFAVLYMPQFIRFVRDYLGMYGRVSEAFGELLLVSDPKPPVPRTIVEKELIQLWNYAYSRGSRDVVERVNMVVDSFTNFIRQVVRSGFVYGPFIAVSYAMMIALTAMLLALHAPALASSAVSSASGITGAVSFIAGLANTNLLFTMLIILGASTSIIVGKAMHSIGLGVGGSPNIHGTGDSPNGVVVMPRKTKAEEKPQSIDDLEALENYGVSAQLIKKLRSTGITSPKHLLLFNAEELMELLNLSELDTARKVITAARELLNDEPRPMSAKERIEALSRQRIVKTGVEEFDKLVGGLRFGSSCEFAVSLGVVRQ